MLRHIAKDIARRNRPAALKLLALFNTIRGLPSAARLAVSGRRLRSANILRRDRRIIFVSERPGQREAKLAFGLKLMGWDVIQLHHHSPGFSDLSSFVDFQRYTSPWHALDLAHRAKSRLFHVFSPGSDDICLQFVNHKPGRVIIDIYDYFYVMAAGMPALESRYAVDIARQRHCIERADALCCRDLKLQYGRKLTGLGTGKPLVYFPEYCWNLTPLPDRRPDNEIHIVQIGWMGFETRGANDSGCFRILEKFVQAGCHVHVYLHPSYPPVDSPAFRSLFADYLLLAASTGRVHMHPTVPADRLIDELKVYDFGFGLINAMAFDIPYRTISPVHLQYAGSSRMFDYLDAGLGLLMSPQLRLMQHQFRFTGLSVDGSELISSGRIQEGLTRPPHHRIAVAREQLSIARNIHRLTGFYDRLI